jgi:hypothetical protein
MSYKDKQNEHYRCGCRCAWCIANQAQYEAAQPSKERRLLYRRVLKVQPVAISFYFRDATNRSWQALCRWYAAFWHCGYIVYCAVRAVTG